MTANSVVCGLIWPKFKPHQICSAFPDYLQFKKGGSIATVLLFFLAHLSRRLIGELIVYPCSGVRRSSTISNIFSETACPIKAKFYMEPPWVGGTKVCLRHLGHMTKMAATPIYGKYMVKAFQKSPEPAGRFPRNLV